VVWLGKAKLQIACQYSSISKGSGAWDMFFDSLGPEIGILTIVLRLFLLVFPYWFTMF